MFAASTGVGVAFGVGSAPSHNNSSDNLKKLEAQTKAQQKKVPTYTFIVPSISTCYFKNKLSYAVSLWYCLGLILSRLVSQQDVKIRNMGSWSSLANLASGGAATKKKPNAMHSFEAFKKQAKEKEERVIHSWNFYIISIEFVLFLIWHLFS